MINSKLTLPFIEIYKTKRNLIPTFIRVIFIARSNQYSLRSENHLQLPKTKKNKVSLRAYSGRSASRLSRRKYVGATFRHRTKL